MRLSWDDIGSRRFEAGVDRGVFFPKTGAGVAWNGLTSVKESVDNDGTLVIYIDGRAQANQLELGAFSAMIEALTYPDEMLPYDGYVEPIFSGQKRDLFHFSYRSLLGNDLDGLSYGYRLHLIYNCLLTPSDRTHETVDSNADISTFSWQLSTTPVATPYNRPTAHLYLDSPNLEQDALTAIENILYGQESIDPRMPSIAEVLAIFEANAIFTVVDNGDGTATITGPDDWVFEVATDQYQISSPSLYALDDTRIFASSY